MELWRRNQIAVTAASFVGFTGFTLVMPFLARYMQDMGLTSTGEVALWTGLTLGVTPAVSASVAPLWGRVGDRFGNKLLVQRSLFSSIIVMVLMSRASHPWHLFALRALQGLVEARELLGPVVQCLFPDLPLGGVDGPTLEA